MPDRALVFKFNFHVIYEVSGKLGKDTCSLKVYDLKLRLIRTHHQPSYFSLKKRIPWCGESKMSIWSRDTLSADSHCPPRDKTQCIR